MLKHVALVQGVAAAEWHSSCNDRQDTSSHALDTPASSITLSSFLQRFEASLGLSKAEGHICCHALYCCSCPLPVLLSCQQWTPVQHQQSSSSSSRRTGRLSCRRLLPLLPAGWCATASACGVTSAASMGKLKQDSCLGTTLLRRHRCVCVPVKVKGLGWLLSHKPCQPLCVRGSGSWTAAGLPLCRGITGVCVCVLL